MDTNKSYAAQVARHLAIYAAGVLGVLVLVIYVLAFFAGSAGSSVNGNAINIERNSITIALSEEPPQLDSTRSTDASSFIVLAHTMEGLISYDNNDQLIPGVAARWEIRDDGATFWLSLIHI